MPLVKNAPKPAPAKVAPSTAKPAPVKAPPKVEWLYPVREAEFRDGDNAITCEEMKQIMGWETEKEYTARRKDEDPTLKDEELVYGEDYLLEDEEGNKVRCARNGKNRPLEIEVARKYAQDILNRNFAGPITLPGETVNGESFIISRTGEVISGQHRGVGLILAGQLWEKNHDHWSEKWATEPVLETLLVTGISENPKVIQTLDNVRPRSLSDVIYTSDIYKGLTSTEKKECSRMLDRAVDFLWLRTRPDPNTGGGTSFTKYQTHSESLSFIENHKTICKIVKHIFEENKERALSVLGLSGGHCSGVFYLQASCDSDGDTYRNMDTPSEKGKAVNFEQYDTAARFWQEIVKKEGDGVLIREAIALLADPSTGMGGREIEKSSVLAKAWSKFVQGEELTREDLTLEYLTNSDGVKKLKMDNIPDFGGLDLGPKKSASASATEEDISAEKAEETARKLREERAQKAIEKAEKMGSPKDVAEAKAALAAKSAPPSGNGETSPAKPSGSKKIVRK